MRIRILWYKSIIEIYWYHRIDIYRKVEIKSLVREIKRCFIVYVVLRR